MLAARFLAWLRGEAATYGEPEPAWARTTRGGTLGFQNAELLVSPWVSAVCPPVRATRPMAKPKQATYRQLVIDAWVALSTVFALAFA